MVDEKAIDRLSIRARVALGATCAEMLCNRLNVQNDEIARHIQFFWQFVEEPTLSDWEWDYQSAPEIPNDLEAFREKYESSHLTDLDISNLIAVLQSCEDIATGNLYAGYRSAATREPTLSLLRIVEQMGVSTPDLAVFSKSPATQDDGWGFPVRRAFFRSPERNENGAS